MKFGSVIIIISILVYVNANHEICVNGTKEDTILVELTSGIRQFSKTFMKHVRETQIGNYVVSPLSLHLALSMITIGAGGSTSVELHKALGTDHIKYGILQAYKILSEKLWTIYSNLQLHQKIWLSNNFIPNSEFVSRLRKGFANAAIGVLNFSNTESATKLINRWFQLFSKGDIVNLTNLGEISKNSSIIISSTLNFKGALSNRLEAKYTTFRKFDITETLSKEVPMMLINGPIIYGLLPEIKACFIKYDLSSHELSMIIIRPNEIKDFIRLDQQLETINISDILDRGNLINMSFFLPKFNVQTSLELNDFVKTMGVVQIFNPRANFSGISDKELKVDRIIQKISVNIDGNEAAASSLTDILYSKRIYKRAAQNFDVNVPFHFVVLHDRTKLPLIRGRIKNPLFI